MSEREPSHLNTPPEEAPADASAETLPPTPAINEGEVPPPPRSKFEDEPKYVALSVNSLKSKLGEIKTGDDLEAYENYAHALFKQNKQSTTIGFHVFELGKSTTDSTGKKKHGLKYQSWPKIQGLFQDRLADIILENGSGTQTPVPEQAPADDDIVYDGPAPTITEVPPVPTDEHLLHTAEASASEDAPVPAVEVAEVSPVPLVPATLDQGPSPVGPIESNETESPYDGLGFYMLRDHPIAGPILEEECLDFLRNHGDAWFNKNYTGEVDNEGYLLHKDGSPSNEKPSFCIGGEKPMKEITRATRLIAARVANQSIKAKNNNAISTPGAESDLIDTAGATPANQETRVESTDAELQSLVAASNNPFKLWSALRNSGGIEDPYVGFLTGDDLAVRFALVRNKVEVIEVLPSEYGIREKARELLEAAGITPLTNQETIESVDEGAPKATAHDEYAEKGPVLSAESISKAGSLHELAKIFAYSEGINSENAGTLSADDLVGRLQKVESQDYYIELLPLEFGIQAKARELFKAEKIKFFSFDEMQSSLANEQGEQVHDQNTTTQEQDQNIPATEENPAPPTPASAQEKIKMHYSGDENDNEGNHYDDETWTNTGYGKDDGILKIINEEDLVHANSTPKSNGAGGGSDGIMYKLIKGTRKFFSGLWKGIRISFGFAKGVSDEISATKAVDKNKKKS